MSGAEDSWRVTQTRRGHSRHHHQQIHGPFPQAAIADVANLFGESYEDPGIGGFLHGADPSLPNPIRILGVGS